MTLSHLLTPAAFGESFSDPKLAKRLPGCVLTPYLPPINPIKKMREPHVLISQQQVKTKPSICRYENLLTHASSLRSFAADNSAGIQ
jgi:hypothetical protein